MIKYPSIPSFKELSKQVAEMTRYCGKNEDGYPLYDDSIPLPTLTFFGSEKLHGSCSSLHYIHPGKIICQSRNRELSLDNDNLGFCRYITDNKDYYLDLFEHFNFYHYGSPEIVVHGEFCGRGIQKGVAVSQLSKRFMIFGLQYKVDDQFMWVPVEELVNVLEPYKNIVIANYKTWEIEIDFNNTKPAQEQINAWVEEVDKESPLGKEMGVIGPGEGLVLSHLTSHINKDAVLLQFKSKGKSHVIVNSREHDATGILQIQYQAAKDFVNDVVTEYRLNQGLDYFREMKIDIDIKNLGKFLTWTVKDVLHEEGSSINENNLDLKMVKREISNIAKEFFFKYLEVITDV